MPVKNNKSLLPTLILAVAVLAIAVCSVVSSLAFKPTVTEGEFPFSITYELDGKRVTVQDVYKVHYVRNDGYADTKSRIYAGELASSGEDHTIYTIKNDGSTYIELWTHFYADYLMGDSEYNYFDDKAFEPKIYYFAEEQEFSDEKTLAEQGVKLISFEYPTPIENSLVFSHVSYFSSAIVPPTLLISLLALIATIFLVRKEKELKYKAIDFISIVLNFIVGIVYMGFVTVLALLIDVEGGGPELYYQIMYFIPALSVLCIAASVALRRKGYGKGSLITQFIGPVIFAFYLLIFYMGGLL